MNYICIVGYSEFLECTFANKKLSCCRVYEMKTSLFFKLSVVYWAIQAVLLYGFYSSAMVAVVAGSIFLALCCLMLLVKSKVARAIASVCLIAYSSLFLLSACMVLPFIVVPFVFYVVVGVTIVANFIMALLAFRFSRAAGSVEMQ